MFAADIEKAFDSLEWDYLYGVKVHMRPGTGFLTWTKLLYRDPVGKAASVEPYWTVIGLSAEHGRDVLCHPCSSY